MQRESDSVVVGGGFYGLMTALHLSKNVDQKIILTDEGKSLFAEASFYNQARIHGGYHYPRDLVTGKSCQRNYRSFCERFSQAVVPLESYYAIAKHRSHITAQQFATFCKHIQAPFEIAPASIKTHFNDHMIEEVFLTEECAFNAQKLKQQLLDEIQRRPNIHLETGEKIESINHQDNRIHLKQANGSTLTCKETYLCCYGGTNLLLNTSELKPIELQFEQAEVSLTDPPSMGKNIAVTVMDGPFFSWFPFPSTPYYSLSHVTFTPHDRAKESPGSQATLHNDIAQSNFSPMQLDAARYLPAIAKTKYQGHFLATKVILPRNTLDDGRPILFKKDYGYPGLHVIIGGKLDNIFDILMLLDK